MVGVCQMVPTAPVPVWESHLQTGMFTKYSVNTKQSKQVASCFSKLPKAKLFSSNWFFWQDNICFKTHVQNNPSYISYACIHTRVVVTSEGRLEIQGELGFRRSVWIHTTIHMLLWLKKKILKSNYIHALNAALNPSIAPRCLQVKVQTVWTTAGSDFLTGSQACPTPLYPPDWISLILPLGSMY